MNILIVEDEPLAAARLRKMVKDLEPGAIINGALDSVTGATKWFRENRQPDLVFMDIQLSDGISFLIFEQVKISAPVIFTTAFDEYAIKAFKVNSIDYLLKPIDGEDLASALKKFHSIRSNNDQSENLRKALSQLLPGKRPGRLLVKMGERLIPLDISNISYFFADEKIVIAVDKDGKKYPLDLTLEELQALTPSDGFFRISRKYLMNRDSIQTIKAHFNGRLKLEVLPPTGEEMMVSRERVSGFKDWLQG